MSTIDLEIRIEFDSQSNKHRKEFISILPGEGLIDHVEAIGHSHRVGENNLGPAFWKINRIHRCDSKNDADRIYNDYIKIKNSFMDAMIDNGQGFLIYLKDPSYNQPEFLETA